MSPEIIAKQHQERLGKVLYNKFGSKMEIIEYNSSPNITVKFENGYITHSSYRDFIRGGLTSPYDKTVCGHGYLGEGKYKASDENKKRTKQYMHWQEMLRRCYDLRLHKRYPTYIGCTVCDEWLNFQVFGEWYDNNIYELKNVDKKELNLDKDILIKHNKHYSPETCVFVPKSINTLFTKCNASRGLYPIGVCLDKRDGKFRSECNDGKGNDKKLGRFPTPELAFSVYKEYKEALIKKIANAYKLLIPDNLYLAMINYKVEITD